MAALARGRVPALAAIALLGGALLLGGCSMKNGRSQVAGIELIEQPGAAVSAWSPDGRRIAFPVPGGIGIRRLDGTGQRSIGAAPIRGDFGRAPPIEWSGEDGALHYLTAVGPERRRGYWTTRVRPDGGGLRQRPLLGGAAGEHEEPVHSGDGRLVLFKRRGHGGSNLWVADADDSDERRLAHFLYLSHYRFSPDGARVALVAAAADGDGGGLYVIATDGGKPHLVSSEGIADGPSWSPDGRWLTFSNLDGAVRRIHPDGSGIETIAEFGDEEVRGLIWSPNGRHLLYSARPFPSGYD